MVMSLLINYGSTTSLADFTMQSSLIGHTCMYQSYQLSLVDVLFASFFYYCYFYSVFFKLGEAAHWQQQCTVLQQQSMASAKVRLSCRKHPIFVWSGSPAWR